MALSSERLAARRRHLVEVAQALIRERGDAGFSMLLLAERAGVSAATPYNLLGSKSEILRLVVREDVRRFVGELEGRPGETPLRGLLAAADFLVGYYERDRAFHAGLFRAAFNPDAPEVGGILASESRAWWKGRVGAAIEGGELARIVRPGRLTDTLLRVMGSVAQAWLVQDWRTERFTLEMGLSVRLALASVAVPSLQAAMTREMIDLQAAIDGLPAREAAAGS